ncbi:histone deacetylase family protein [Methanobacterium oryzae]|uniref:histone deacetylase family protein n=1 Tax=Methanobacterium oryzae TaxID=69540 RepID=UPI003D1D3062
MTALIYSDEYMKHNTGNHPENQERLNVIVNSLKNKEIWNKIDVISPEPATEDDLLRVHSPSHIEYIKKFCDSGGGYIDYDTFAAPESYEIAKLAAGGAIKAADFVLKNSENAYSIARPPGHHATREKSMGFCIFNNLAIALEYLRNTHKIKKFLIFDFDVHFGNGTSEIFYSDPDVLYISIHQNPRTLYPGKGFIEEIGTGKGEGYNLNIPMPERSTTDDYIYILEKILEPAASKFNADFYFLDVGFDGHVDDPLSSMALTDKYYEYIINKMKNIAGFMSLILEGGYNLDVLSRCNVKIINALNNIKNEDYYKNELNVSENTKDTFNKIKDVFSPFYGF